jgi:hypothetical protein
MQPDLNNKERRQPAAAQIADRIPQYLDFKVTRIESAHLLVINPIARKQATAKALSIPVRSLAAQPDRVTTYATGVEAWDLRSAVEGPFQDFDDFYTRGVDKVPTAVRRYEVSGHACEVVIPESYAAQLSCGSTEFKNRLTPADLPALLDAMPNSSYFKKIYVSDHRNPEDAWVNQTGFSTDFRAAMSMVNAELTTYMTERSNHLRRDILHEWSHQLRYEYWDTAITDRFKNAVDLESDWKPNAYAGRNNGEQWAVLGERMLGNSGEDFLEAANFAPLRTVVYMRALKLCLGSVSAEHKSVDHKYYVARQRYVDEKILPLAQRKLSRLLSHGSRDEKAWAADLLRYLQSEGLIAAA